MSYVNMENAMRILIGGASILSAYFLLVLALDAPAWAGVIGSWVFWIAVRPKAWQ